MGFKIVGDNVDKIVKASFQRHEIKSQSLHASFHCYAVRDRVPTDSFSDLTPVTCVPDPAQLLPSLEDLECVRLFFCHGKSCAYTFKTVIMYYDILHRIIVQHMDQFKPQAKEIIWHIPIFKGNG